jgi:predicted metal-binding membrane protein
MIIEQVARRPQFVAIAVLSLVAAVSIFITIKTGDWLMMMPGALSVPWLALMFTMWWSMMLAMMLPSAAPAILLHGALTRRHSPNDAGMASFAFASGYALVWAGFSVAAVLLHIAIERFSPFDGMMELQSQRLGAVLLIAAGLYQFTPFKQSCLSHCQSPLHFFAHGWRKGLAGAVRMGVSHGLYCTGCCAVLMGLLFYGGVMDFWWIAGLAIYVLFEKLLAWGRLLPSLSGAILIVWGLTILLPTFMSQTSP